MCNFVCHLLNFINLILYLFVSELLLFIFPVRGRLATLRVETSVVENTVVDGDELNKQMVNPMTPSSTNS